MSPDAGRPYELAGERPAVEGRERRPASPPIVRTGDDASSPARFPSVKAKVLLVDDSAELRELYELTLENEGYDVRAAGTGEEALEIARRWRPDLVVTDIFMAGMNGLELITHLRSDLAPPVPLVVAISGSPDARDEALHRGAAHFASKPLGWDALVELVRCSLAHQSTRRHEQEVERHRATKRAVAEGALDAYLRRDPELIARLRKGAGALSRYLDGITVLIHLLHPIHLWQTGARGSSRRRVETDDSPELEDSPSCPTATVSRRNPRPRRRTFRCAR